MNLFKKNSIVSKKKVIILREEEQVLYDINYLRGLFAVLIVLGHCSMKFAREPFVLYVIHKMNFISVCFFLCVSGWSLAYNFDKKDNYLSGFLFRKVLKLGALSIEAQLVGRLLKTLFLKDKFRLDLGILLEWNWYIYECIVMYVLFYIIYKNIPKEKSRTILIWISCIMVALYFWAMFNVGSWSGWTFAYYYSTLSFAMGITIHELYKKNIINMFFLKRACFISLLLVAANMYCIKMPKASIMGGVVMHNVLGCSAIVFLVIILEIVKVPRCKLFTFLTKYSVYIYLYQFVILLIIFQVYIEHERIIDFSYVALVIVFLLLLSFSVKGLNDVMMWAYSSFIKVQDKREI